MKIFIYGILIGICKIIPGVSGSLLAVTLGIYERAIDSITNFFKNPKENIKFLLSLSFGIIISIIFMSKLIIKLMDNYYLYFISCILGLLVSSTIKDIKNIHITKKKLFIIISIILSTILFTYNSNYLINLDKSNMSFFISGIIEVLTSILPGISGTSIFLLLGVYDDVMLLIANATDINYILSNISYYISYSSGIFISFILSVSLINYIIKNKKELFEIIILSLSISSIILLILSLNIELTFINIVSSIFIFTLTFVLGLIYKV